jgi:hypothetical protein
VPDSLSDPGLREGPTSSRDSVAGAGWQCEAGAFEQLLPKRTRPFSWLSPVPLWQSRNDRLARRFGDPTNDRRRAWMKGDASQYAVVPPLLAQGADTDFLFICSDVIYPAGGVDAYRDKFFRAYRDYPGPIYAVRRPLPLRTSCAQRRAMTAAGAGTGSPGDRSMATGAPNLAACA